MVNKIIKDGKVAVLYSPGFGAGWYSWNYDEGTDMLFDPVLVQYVLDKKMDEAASYVAIRFPGAYTGGLDDLTVQWISEGTAFRIHEYDGSERIEIKEDIDWVVA